MRLLVSTRNPGKLAEIRAIFDLPGVELAGADDIPGLPEVEEDRDTLEGNAAKKAAVLASASGLWTLADDTGLEVDALNGAPGVRSARYAGEDGNAARNGRKLLAALDGETRRSARFRTVIALSSPGGAWRCVDGVCEGTITEAPRGEGGFGYDPVFVPAGSDLTFAEMTAERKNAISHRARALQAARAAWGDLLASGRTDW